MRFKLTVAWAFSFFLAAFVAIPGAFANEAPEEKPLDPEFLCPRSENLAHPTLCPGQARGEEEVQLRAYELPLELPETPAVDVEYDPYALTHSLYARVRADAPVYASPEAGFNGEAPIRLLGLGIDSGFVFVTLEDLVVYQEEEWFRINKGEFVRRSEVSISETSQFGGVTFEEQLERPFAWLVSTVHPMRTPGGEINQDVRPLRRYDTVQIFNTVNVDGWDWYQVGHNQWVEQRTVSVLNTPEPPEEVSGRWIAVNLFEQTLAAYEDDELVYATLISSGLDAWQTNQGLFQIYARLESDDMSGAFAADRSDYYSLENVPWTQYFDGAIALHGAYWHDGFGYQRSHGCVNLSPTDAKWIYDWADDDVYVWVFNPEDPDDPTLYPKPEDETSSDTN